MENPATSLCIPKLCTTVKWYLPIRYYSYTTCISLGQPPVTLYYELLEEPNSQLLQEKGYSDDFWSPEGTTGSLMGSLMLIYFITWSIYKVPSLIQRAFTDHIVWTKQCSMSWGIQQWINK